ncbi:helix-turn-helix domain-containing protein [Bacillus safensis]|uniref:helix-turn-helix domain-containing protein n=1 Tax=Bacillus TaxID=1386 RepID=UPI0002C01663|nr:MULTISPECIES: helix-turn-helix transcriptional regulator [Bacillus]EMI15206.1 helix-turn-helix domain protein [Bacillus stratosphericus LAMA 585]MCY7585480.1 helix-turn-helix domain-containing protein [Bacillus safensis]MCY7586915.1 helix-turn-helix domain-containing protein [Bacillus safensis]MCY7611000.1 helix-turn-helix domain-containing protein [Bacillus safensis]MCY7630814.1 helix-turn-helix domain-containing protein [Bacillus altitudinis]
MGFPENLKRLRNQYDFNQSDLAALLNISKSNISKYESGDLEPSLKTLIQLCKIFKVSMDELIGIPKSFISPRNDFIDDFKGINTSIVDAKFQPYLEQFSETIYERFKNTQTSNKAFVTITLDFMDDILNTNDPDELREISDDITKLWGQYVAKRLHKN